MPAAHARGRAPVLRGRGRLYDAACALIRVGLGCAFTHYALGLRGRESELGEHMSGSVLVLYQSGFARRGAALRMVHRKAAESPHSGSYMGFSPTQRGAVLSVATGRTLADAALAPLGLLSPALPALLVAVSIAFVVGLLTRVAGPLLAATVLFGHLAPASAELAPFSGWGTSAAALAACLLVVAAPDGGPGTASSWPLPRVHGHGPETDIRAGPGQKTARFPAVAPNTRRHCSILWGGPSTVGPPNSDASQ